MPKQYIVMADVIDSRSYGGDLLPEFSRIVDECNSAFAGTLLSPYTITLGDEFQGVADSLGSAVDSVLFLEERLLTVSPAFLLRYVIVHGRIDTPVNPRVAHGMTGTGLAIARDMLTRKRRGRRRFQLYLPGNPYANTLSMLFRLLELLSGHWKQKDYELISELLRKNDEAVATHCGKTKSQIWKRRKTLQIEEYMTVKELLHQAVAHCESDT